MTTDNATPRDVGGWTPGEWLDVNHNVEPHERTPLQQRAVDACHARSPYASVEKFTAMVDGYINGYLAGQQEPAAPELYAALVRLERAAGYVNSDYPELDDAMTDARLALAKARKGGGP